MTEPQATQPQIPLFELIGQVWAIRAAAAFARLHGPDKLGDRSLTTAGLARAMEVDADALGRILRVLTRLGIVERTNELWRLTAYGAQLRSDVPGSLRHFLMAETDACHWLSWGQVEHSLRTGRPAAPEALGTDAWSYLQARPDDARVFAASMTNISAMATGAVLEAYDFSEARHIVDVGGSQGAFLAAVLAVVPQAKATLFDQPHVVADGSPVLASAGLTDRVELRGGSFFDAVPSGGDIYLLKHILHDWNDDDSIRILRHCHRVLPPAGRVLVVES
ncbi:MAG: methyltransferase, partial [Polyangiales bacterium]